MKPYIKIILALLVLLMVGGTAGAAPVENDSSSISNGIFEADYTRLPDDSEAHYHLDFTKTTPEEQENNAVENFIDNVQNFNPVGNTAEEMFAEYMNTMLNVVFNWNMMMVNFMIGVLNFGFDTDIVNGWIDSMEGMVQSMAGVSNGNIVGGIFGALAGLAAMTAAAAFVYKMIMRGSPIAGINVLIKSSLAFAAAFLLFANFAPLMKGMNELSSELSSTMLTGTMNTINGENQTPEEVRDDVASNLWNEFIGRPYMIMQYGTDDIDEIGIERVNELLAIPPGEERTEFIAETEVGDRGNENLSIEALPDKAAFTGIYSVINMIVSIPILLLGIAMVIFQLWFLMIAFLSPFALIVAAFPGQFSVLARYAVELIYPLIWKVIATVATLFMFTFGFMIYGMETSSVMSHYFISAIMQFGLFGVFFLGRKRIARILTAGQRGPFEMLSADVNGLKHAMNDASSKIGSVGQAISHVGLAAATGGGSAVGSVVTSLVTKRVTQETVEEQSAPTENTNSKPLVNDEQGPAANTAPLVNDEPAENTNSKPLVDDQEPATASEPIAPEASEGSKTFVEPAPAAEVKVEPEETKVDLSKPLVDDNPNVIQLQVKEQAETTRKEGGAND